MPAPADKELRQRYFLSYCTEDRKTAITGSCLCGGVRFEIDEASGSMEICHCIRCRKTSGSANLTTIGVKSNHYRLVSGRELIGTYAAPVGDFLEIPAGLFDEDPAHSVVAFVLFLSNNTGLIIHDYLYFYSMGIGLEIRSQLDVFAGG